MSSCVALRMAQTLEGKAVIVRLQRLPTTSTSKSFRCCGQPAQQLQLPSQGCLSPDKTFHCLHGDFKTHSRFQSSRKVYHPQISLQFLFKLYIWERSQSQWSKTSTLRIDLDDCLASLASSCTTCTACSQQLQTITRQWAGKCSANAIFEPNTINSSKKRLCA